MINPNSFIFIEKFLYSNTSVSKAVTYRQIHVSINHDVTKKLYGKKVKRKATQNQNLNVSLISEKKKKNFVKIRIHSAVVL